MSPPRSSSVLGSVWFVLLCMKLPNPVGLLHGRYIRPIVFCALSAKLAAVQILHLGLRHSLNYNHSHTDASAQYKMELA